MTSKAKPPELGTRIEASGYMVRYRTGGMDKLESEAEQGAWGWKRKRQPLQGCYCGQRFLGITWWKAHDVFPYDGGNRRVATLPVYAIAVNHRTVRYVLPRDVLAGPAGRDSQ